MKGEALDDLKTLVGELMQFFDLDRAAPVHRVDFVSDIEDFHKKFGLAYDGKPRILTNELDAFRRKFMQEELDEYEEDALDAQLALMSKSPTVPTLIPELLEGMLDALVDLTYVAIGSAYLHGFNFREAWCRVHAANMQKVRQASERSEFDVVKPDGWTAPSHTDLVADHAHKEE
jgi:predicted HAD superfamily Cof-like phosphohydrolase